MEGKYLKNLLFLLFNEIITVASTDNIVIIAIIE